jgi:hypothetical protein
MTSQRNDHYGDKRIKWEEYGRNVFGIEKHSKLQAGILYPLTVRIKK